MSTLKVNEVRHISNTGTANIVLESNANTNLQTTSTKGLSVDGTLTVTGVSTFNGNVVVGNASTDTVTLTSTVTGFNNFSGFTGEIRMYAGNAAGNAPPAGWLYCNGDTISQTTGNGGTHYNADGKNNDYQPLFNLLKTSSDWGNSSSAAWGTNTVKLPDFRSRSPVGVHTGAATSIGNGSDSAALTARTLGDTTGAENHILVTNELPAHLHGATSASAAANTSLAAITATLPNHVHTPGSHTHTLSAHTHSLSAHTHEHEHTHDFRMVNEWNNGSTYDVAFDAGPVAGNATTDSISDATTGGPSNNTSGAPSSDVTGAPSASNTGNPTTNPSITFNNPAVTDSGHSHTITTTNTGGGLKHQNLSPIIAVNYIIKV